MHDTADSELLRRFGAGDREAFAVLVARHHGLVDAACRRQAPSGDAEDCVQAVFLILSRKPGAALRAPVLAAWLQRVACFVCRTARRGAQRRQQAERAAVQTSSPAGATRNEALDHLDDCLLKLPEKQRAALTLHYLAGKPAEEVAQALGTNRNHAYQLINRGLIALRVLLARRGVAVAGTALTSLLAGEAQAAAATVPAAVVTALTTAPTAGATALAQGAISAMTIAIIAPIAAAAGLVLTAGTITVALAAEPTATSAPSGMPPPGLAQDAVVRPPTEPSATTGEVEADMTLIEAAQAQAAARNGTPEYWRAKLRVLELSLAQGDVREVNAALRFDAINRSTPADDLHLQPRPPRDDPRVRRARDSAVAELCRRYLALFSQPGITERPSFTMVRTDLDGTPVILLLPVSAPRFTSRSYRLGDGTRDVFFWEEGKEAPAGP